MKPELTPDMAFKLAEAIHQVGGEVDERLETIIASDSESAYRYAHEILQHPWPEAEVAIARHSTWAYYYVCNMLTTAKDKARFEGVYRWVHSS